MSDIGPALGLFVNRAPCTAVSIIYRPTPGCLLWRLGCGCGRASWTVSNFHCVRTLAVHVWHRQYQSLVVSLVLVCPGVVQLVRAPWLHRVNYWAYLVCGVPRRSVLRQILSVYRSNVSNWKSRPVATRVCWRRSRMWLCRPDCCWNIYVLDLSQCV